VTDDDALMALVTLWRDTAQRQIRQGSINFGGGLLACAHQLQDLITAHPAAPQLEQDIWTPDYLKGYARGLKDAESSGVLQAVLDAINGTLDPHTQIADHPNVKFAQMERLKWTGLMAGFAPAPTDRTTTNTGDTGGPSLDNPKGV
jgi:hypothetical protein